MTERGLANLTCRAVHPEWVAPNGACGQCRQFGWNAEREKLTLERDKAFAAGVRAMREACTEAVGEGEQCPCGSCDMRREVAAAIRALPAPSPQEG